MSAATLQRMDSLAGPVDDVGGTLLNTKLGTERVQAYSDAVLSIVATILVVPLLKVGENSKKEIIFTSSSLWGVLTSQFRLEMLFMCWVAFWFIFVVFVWHGRKFRGLDRANTILVIANWLELLATSLLPFTTATAANASSASGQEGEVIEQYLHFNLLLIALVHLFFQCSAYFTQRSALRALQLQEALCIAVVCLIAMSLSFITEDMVWPVYGLVPVALYAYHHWSQAEDVQAEAQEEDERVVLERRASLGLPSPPLTATDSPCIDINVDNNNDNNNNNNEQVLLRSPMPQQRAIAKSIEHKHAANFHHRIEAFVDGVIAISATLIVLEIQPIAACNGLNDEDCIVHFVDGCRLDIFQNKCVFDDRESWARKNWLVLTYIATFYICNLLWTLHHLCMDSIVSEQNVSDGWTLFFTGHFCMFISLVPSTFSLFTEYAIEPITKHKIDPLHPSKHLNPDEEAASTATVLACVVVYFAGVSLLGIVLHHRNRYGVIVSPSELVRFSLMPVIAAIIAVIVAEGANRWLLLPMFVVPPTFAVVHWIASKMGWKIQGLI